MFWPVEKAGMFFYKMAKTRKYFTAFFIQIGKPDIQVGKNANQVGNLLGT